MTEIIVTTRAELQAIVAEECNRLYARLAKGKTAPESDALTIDKAVEFLTEEGYPLTKNTLYSLANKEEVPFSKFNGKLIFSRKELRQWVLARTEKHTTSKERAAQAIAKTRSCNVVQ